MATLLNVAEADGLSAAEEAWIRDRAAVLGLPAQSLNSPNSPAAKAANGASGDSECLGFVAANGWAVARAMLYDALLLAAQV